jgi:patatin-related protein
MTHAAGAGEEQRPAAPRGPETLIEPLREIRFAVVMYGGVSLAVYINGVAQELFHLVRATAPAPGDGDGPSPPLVPDAALTGSERVYREVARLVGDPPPEDVPGTPPITTRFVVDILSGSSAGGINAVFLGKALANDQPLAPLQQLWLEEGDIGVLINDSGSKLDGVPQEKPPASLLNSRRMYVELLRAIAGMDAARPRDDSFRSPYVEELDAYVTTTDLAGLVLPVKLSNTVARERRYKNVFHFTYQAADNALDARNDFVAGNAPILAFAARSTSAFPFAFEPMRLDDIDGLFAGAPPPPDGPAWEGSGSDRWQRFYRDYLPAPGEDPTVPPFPERSLADGGALDNKPFSWATETLLRRRADVPVDRKLIYIEPDPRDIRHQQDPAERPDALRNLSLQGLSLPRQETIREDIDRVRERNREIQRIDRILAGLDEDIATDGAGGRGTDPAPAAKPGAARDLDDLIEREGQAYGGYVRLRVATVTDDLTELVSLVSGFDLGSIEYEAVRYVIRSWRDARFAYHLTDGDRRESFTVFIQRFDLSTRLRRLAFLMRRIDRLYRADTGPVRAIALRDDGELELAAVGEADRPAFRSELLVMKSRLSAIHRTLRVLGRSLRPRGEESPLWPDLRATNVTRDVLRAILKPPDEKTRQATADTAATERAAALDALAGTVAGILADGRTRPAGGPEASLYGMQEARVRLRSAVGLDPDPDRDQRPGAEAARRALAAATLRFDLYDQIAFPLQYGADLGETDEVEIIRVSPGDATNLVDERTSGKRKLHGWRYGHFGAFLNSSWRANDIMWGRLDGAEILIESIVPQGTPGRRELVERAQAAIVQEELGIDLEAFRREYPTTPHLPAEDTARTLGRGAHVVGQMMNDIGERRGGLLRSPLAWIARVGALASGLIEVALPSGWGHLLRRHLLTLLYVFEGLLIAGGLVFGAPAVQRFGWVTLGITVAVDLLIRIASDVIRGKPVLRAILRVGLLVVVLVLIAMIAAEVPHVGADLRHYWHRWTPW